MKISHDPEADAVYVRMRRGYSAESLSPWGDLDDRATDYAEDGTLLGFEWLGVSQGIDVTDMPVPEEVIAALRKRGFQVTGTPLPAASAVRSA